LVKITKQLKIKYLHFPQGKYLTAFFLGFHLPTFLNFNSKILGKFNELSPKVLSCLRAKKLVHIYHSTKFGATAINQKGFKYFLPCTFRGCAKCQKRILPKLRKFNNLIRQILTNYLMAKLNADSGQIHESKAGREPRVLENGLRRSV